MRTVVTGIRSIPPAPAPGTTMSYEDQRRRYQQQRAERQIVEQAAAHLSHQAILAAYAGLEHKELAFGLALILDELARHFRDLDEQLRERVLDSCRQVLGQG